MKLLIQIIILIIIFLQFSCENNAKKGLLTERDTIQVLKLILTNKKLDSSLSFLYKTQHLRIVKNEWLKKDYRFKINNRPVAYVEIDSSQSGLADWKKPKYYLNILKFKPLNNNQIEGIFQYKSTGIWVEFLVEKKEENWEIVILDISHT